MDQEAIDKAAVLVEALPYIRHFHGKTVVIKYGGAAMAAADLKAAVMQDVALMKYVGICPVVVHGGGPDISNYVKKMGKVPEFVDGLRVTDAETMEIAQMVLVGKTNREIVAALGAQGAPAVGLSGQDSHLVTAVKRHHIKHNGEVVDLGFVGDVAQINPTVIHDLVAAGYVPVVAPIGCDEHGNSYNINADTVAGELAAALKADKLVLLTDVEGVRTDKDDPSSLMTELSSGQIKEWMQAGRLEGGMIPKVEACLTALNRGVGQVHIIDGRIPHALLLEVFTDKGIGTMVIP